MDLNDVHAVARRVTFVTLLAAAAASPTIAQEKRPEAATPTIAIGSRVRFTKPQTGLWSFMRSSKIVGKVTAMDAESITVLPKKGTAVRIPVASDTATSLRVSLGRRAKSVHILASTVGGTLLVGGMAALLGPCYGSLGGCTITAANSRENLMYGVQYGAAFGAFIGIVTHSPERWGKATVRQTPAAEPIPSPSREFQVSPIIDRKGRGAGLSFHLTW